MTQTDQRPTAAFKEEYIEADGFRLRYWESNPSEPLGTVVMLAGMTLAPVQVTRCAGGDVSGH